jgi:signal transduction histidine kinase
MTIDIAKADEPLIVRADRDSLEQMLLNLLVNAVQAAAGAKVLVGGDDVPETSVNVRLSRIDRGRCKVAVGDRGPGLDPAIQRRLFEPFATNKRGGTGLGLVVARQVAEDHGGTIRWERDDERTWFIVELPLDFALENAIVPGES